MPRVQAVVRGMLARKAYRILWEEEQQRKRRAEEERRRREEEERLKREEVFEAEPPLAPH